MINGENNSRLKGFNTEAPTTEELRDAIDGMTDRATAVINLFKPAFNALQQGYEINEGHLFNALESVLLELADIQQTVESYHDTIKADKDYSEAQAMNNVKKIKKTP